MRLTREGKFFIAVTVGIGLAAINTGNNLLYLILGWMLSMILASGVMSSMTLSRLRVRRRVPAQVFANKPFLMEVSVENPKKRTASYSIEVEDIQAGHPLDKRCYFLKVPSGRNQKTAYRHTFTRRGMVEFDGFRISTRYPFALFEKRQSVDSPDTVLVLPHVFPVSPPSPRAHWQGDIISDRVGRQGEFFGLREYRTGDDRRSIHWRSSAKGGRLLIREFEEDSRRRVTLLLDNALPKPPTEGDELALENAVSLTASFAVDYLRRGFAVRVLTRTGEIPYESGPKQHKRILTSLAVLEAADGDAAFPGISDRGAESLLLLPPVDNFEPPHRPRGMSHTLVATDAICSRP